MWFKLGSLLMAGAVILGAFGAHGLKARLSPELLEVYKTAVFYQIIHSLALVIVWNRGVAQTAPSLAAVFFLLGILLFSGSLYALSLTGIRWFGAITPIGGLCFISGWFLLAWKG